MLLPFGLFIHQFLKGQFPSIQERDLCVARKTTAGAVSLHDVYLRLRRVPLTAIGELSRQGGAFQNALAAGEVPGFPGRLPGLGGEYGPLDADRAHLGVLLQELGQLFEDRAVDDAFDLAVAQLGLRLSLELRLGDLDAQDRRQTLPHVLTAQGVYPLEHVLLLGIIVHGPGQSGAQADHVGSALGGVDVVHERIDVLRVAVGVLHGQLDDDIVLLRHEVYRLLVQLGLVVVEVLHELDDAALEVEAVLASGDLVLERDYRGLVQVGQVLELLRQRVVLEQDRLEDGLVGHEGDGGAGAFSRPHLLQRDGHDAPFAPQEMLLAFPMHPHLEPLGEGVHY
ncbi:hypothetical protein DSECCO2_536300 [anaerobic digester metagenome]